MDARSLFGEPIRTQADPIIINKLGDFSLVKNYVGTKSYKEVIGIDCKIPFTWCQPQKLPTNERFPSRGNRAKMKENNPPYNGRDYSSHTIQREITSWVQNEELPPRPMLQSWNSNAQAAPLSNLSSGSNYADGRLSTANSTEHNKLKKHRLLRSGASRLKRKADECRDTIERNLLYLEAGLFYILASESLEEVSMTREATEMFETTETFFMECKFQINTDKKTENIQSKVDILRLRCRSLIHLKLHKLHETQRSICKRSDATTKNEVPNGKTPSPRFLTNLVETQSSGSTTPFPVELPVPVLYAFTLKNNHSPDIASCHDLWQEAQDLIANGGHAEFFFRLDQEHGPITFNSTMNDLVKYVKTGLHQLKFERLKQL